VLQWVADGSPSHSTPIKLESPNQFIPLGTSKKEFKRIQAAVSFHSRRPAGGSEVVEHSMTNPEVKGSDSAAARRQRPMTPQAGNTEGVIITVLLTSCLIGLESDVLQLTFLFLFAKQTNPKQSNRR
jgi:hypothetical protein